QLCGGQLRPGDAACFGSRAEAFFAEFYADKAFLGSGGVHIRAGLTDYHPPEVITRRTIIAQSAASYVLADSSKLGTIAVHRVCPLSRVTAVLTDDDASTEATEAPASAGCTVMRAGPPGPPGAPRGVWGDGSPQERGGLGGSSPRAGTAASAVSAAVSSPGSEVSSTPDSLASPGLASAAMENTWRR